MRLIDADALALKVQRYGIMYGDEDATDEMRERYMLKMIADMPTISPDGLRPKGRWIDRPSVKGQVYCSECATIEKVTDSNYKSRSCPNCGADMREEKT